MSAKFDNVLLKDGNTITKDQAKTVARIYLKDVKLDMILRFQSYLNSDFEEHVKKQRC